MLERTDRSMLTVSSPSDLVNCLPQMPPAANSFLLRSRNRKNTVNVESVACCSQSENKETKKCLRSVVQLWSVANYHWYLKQSLEFGPDPQKVPVCVCWDPERPLRLHVVTRSWTSITYDWGWTTERSTGLDATDNASVAVIDGGKGQ